MRQGGQISGLLSLMTIFCSLSLCVFAILTLASADRERRFAELNERRAAAYYAADCEAVRKLASLDLHSVSEGERTAIAVPIGDNLTLYVEAERRNDQLAILRWQTAYTGGWEPEETIEVWAPDGTMSDRNGK